MSQIVHERPAEADVDEALDGLDSGASINTSDILDRIWRFFISMRTGLWLILALGLLSLIGTLLEQAPAGMSADPAAYAGWLTRMNLKYGGWTTVFDKLGFFAVFTSYWFKAIMVLLTTSVLACSVNRAPRLWKLATHPRIRMGETFFTHAPLRATVQVPTGPDETLDDVRVVLGSYHFRTINDPDDEGLNLYADRFRWGPFGSVLAHLSFVLILVGFFVSASTGFKDNSVTIAVGSTVQVGHGSGLAIKANAFNDAYYEDGSPSDYASELVLYKNGVQVLAETIRVNHPMRFDGVSIYQSYFGTAAAMLVKDASGKTVYQDSVPLQWQSNDGKHSIGEFVMKSRGLSVLVIDAASGETDPNIKAGQVQLEVDQDGKKDPIATIVVDQGKPTTIGGLTYTFERPRQFTGLSVARDTGAIFVWLGAALLVVGLYMVFFFPLRRVWVRVRKTSGGSEVLFASTLRRDSAFAPQFQQLVADIQLGDSSSSTTDDIELGDSSSSTTDDFQLDGSPSSTTKK